MDETSGLNINVVETSCGTRGVAINIPDFSQMLILTPDSAREMAYLLVQCADFLNPPFVDAPGPESAAIFGPYDVNEKDDDEEDEERFGWRA